MTTLAAAAGLFRSSPKDVPYPSRFERDGKWSMGPPVDLLLITCNRLAYLQRTIKCLMNDPSEFRIYWWDNDSTAELRELVRSHADVRLVEARMSAYNVHQGIPTRWFLDVARSDVIGKIDDDVLLPAGWTGRFASMVRQDPMLGMLGCWMYMPEDWNEALASHNIVLRAGCRIFQSVAIGGCSFVARKQLLERFFLSHLPPGLPVDRAAMSLAGFVSGYPLPLALAHHMDDPRSPHCRMRSPDRSENEVSYTMKHLGFDSLEEYADWIANDARTRQVIPFQEQLDRVALQRDRSLWGRVKRRFRGALRARNRSL